MIKFDAVLRDEFSYIPYGEKSWKGVTHEVLTVENGFAGWIKVEKECEFKPPPRSGTFHMFTTGAINSCFVEIS